MLPPFFTLFSQKEPCAVRDRGAITGAPAAAYPTRASERNSGMYSRGAFPSLSPTGHSLSESSAVLLVPITVVYYIITTFFRLVKSRHRFFRFFRVSSHGFGKLSVLNRATKNLL